MAAEKNWRISRDPELYEIYVASWIGPAAASAVPRHKHKFASTTLGQHMRSAWLKWTKCSFRQELRATGEVDGSIHEVDAWFLGHHDVMAGTLASPTLKVYHSWQALRRASPDNSDLVCTGLAHHASYSFASFGLIKKELAALLLSYI